MMTFTAWQDPGRGDLLTLHRQGCTHTRHHRGQAWDVTAAAVEQAAAELAEEFGGDPADWVEVAPCARKDGGR